MNNLLVILIGLAISAFTGFNDATWAIIVIGIVSGVIDWLLTPWQVLVEKEKAE